MTLCPCRYSPSGALPRRKLHTWSSSCTQSPGNSTHVVVAATTAVGVGSTLFAVTSTAMMRSIRRGRLVERTCRGGHLGHHGTNPFETQTRVMMFSVGSAPYGPADVIAKILCPFGVIATP